MLHFLCTCHTKQRNKLIKMLNYDQLQAIVECNHNVIKGTVPLSDNQLLALKQHRTHLINLDQNTDSAHLQGTVRREALAKKRRRILQQGGVLPALLAPLLGAIITPLIKAGVGAVSHSVGSRRKRKLHEKQHREYLDNLKRRKR
ncbi:MAG: hypothetical protein QF667_00980 [Candidatus Marinimicrobia bacterium]|nr:hypothetical protein [Candidatus Neomarinimicrobiota bacterium]